MIETRIKTGKRRLMQRNENTSKAIENIDVRVFTHATENQQRVETAVKNIFPEEIAQSIIFKETKLAGHHSNSIILVSAKIDNKKLLPSALERFGEKPYHSKTRNS